MSAGRDLRDVLTTADHCHGIVVRDGREDVCGKPPVAIVDGRATEDEGYWPACAWHANRCGPCVPLADLLAGVEPRIRAEALRGAADFLEADADAAQGHANPRDYEIVAWLREKAAASTGEGDR